MKLYKYTAAKYAKSLVEEGKFRIGTLYEYRAVEHHIGVSDPNEGIKTVRGSLTGNYKTSEDVPKDFLQHAGINIAGSVSNISFVDARFNNLVSSENAYIWCASDKKAIEVQNQFEGADSCVEIFNPSAFFHILDQFMYNTYKAKARGHFRIAYQERVEEWQRGHSGIHPGLIKEPKFSLQKEVRAIWETHDPNIVPVYGTLPLLTRYCRHVNLN